MRHKTAQMWRISGLLTLVSVLAMGAGSSARAQLPVFDSVDWISDRGAINQVVVTGNPAGGTNEDAFRPGYNGYLIIDPPGIPSSISLKNNDPGPAVPRWVFPRSSDLVPVIGAASSTIVVDNATRTYLQPPGNYASPPAPFADDPDYPNGDYVTDAQGNRVRATPLPPGPFADGTYDPQSLAHMRYVTAGSINWTLPDVLPFDVNDYRSQGGLGGFSINSDPTLPWDYDYAFTPAVYNPFIVNHSDGSGAPVTSAELTELPNPIDPDVLNSINNTLSGTPQLVAIYSMGAYNAAAGSYAVDVWMPGDGTFINGVAHPSISRAFVRVSWGNSVMDGFSTTVDAFGNFNLQTINNPQFSKIFLVDMEGPGWYTLASGGQNEAAIPFDGTGADTITVEIYTLTPDNTNPGSSTAVCADAPDYRRCGSVSAG